MKKIMVILACVAMLFSFASCDDSPSSSTNETGVASTAISALNEYLTTDAATDLATDTVVAYADDSTATFRVELPAAQSMGDVTGTIDFTFKAAKAATAETPATTSGFDFVANLVVVDGVFGNHNVTISGQSGYTDAVVTLTKGATADKNAAKVTTAWSTGILPATVSFSNISAEEAEKVIAAANVTTLAAYKNAVVEKLEADDLAAKFVKDGWTFTDAVTSPAESARSAYISLTSSPYTFEIEGTVGADDSASSGQRTFTITKVIIKGSLSDVIDSATATLDLTATLGDLAFTIENDGGSDTVTGSFASGKTAATLTNIAGTATFDTPAVKVELP